MTNNEYLVSNFDSLSADQIVPEPIYLALTGASAITARKERMNGSGCKYIKFGAGRSSRIGYRVGDIRDFFKSRTFNSVAEQKVKDAGVKQ